MSHADLLMGFDVGTTSVKGAVYKTTGECVFAQSLRYPTLIGPMTGWVEQDPAEWMGAIRQICAAAMAVVNPEKIVALGLTSQVNTHLFVDSSGQPLMNAIVWQDQRCADAAAKLDAAIPDSLRAECWGKGFRPDPSFLMSRAQWVYDERPDLWAQTRWILSPKAYCLMQLTGQVADDAMSSVGMVDGNGHYLVQAFGLIDGLAEKLPPLHPIEAIIGYVDQAFLPSGCPAVTGIMDAWASLYGSGVSTHGDAFQIAGTSEVMGVVSNENHGAPGIISFPPLPGWTLHAGPTQMGGEAVNWFAGFMAIDAIEQVFALAEEANAHQNPLLFLPHVMGERAPIWDSSARGAFLGLNRTHTLADMAKAVLEGVGYAGRWVLDGLEQAAGFAVESMAISGGGARSDLWCQIKADILNRPLQRLTNIDTGVFGAALIAGVGTGVYANFAEAAKASVTVENRFVPNPANRGYYEDLFGLYQKSYHSLVEVNLGLQKVGEWGGH